MIIDKIKNWPIYFKKHIFKKIKKFNKKTPNSVYKQNEDYYFNEL